jgi:hypothetical protein
MELYDIIIIGSGISGLYSAYKIKKINPNAKILILEKNKKNKIGGRANNYLFEGSSVVIGAGIVRKKKDKLLIKLLNELNIEMHEFIAKSQHIKNIQPCFLKNIFTLLKNKYNSKIDNNKTFKKYALSKLGKETYKKFVTCSGFTDYEKEDAYDTLYDYGFNDNYSKFTAFSISWKKLVNELVNKIGIENIFTSHDVTNINLIKNNVNHDMENNNNDNYYSIKTIFNKNIKLYNTKKIIIATTASTVKKLMNSMNFTNPINNINYSIYNKINGQPFLRLYGKFAKKNIELLKKVVPYTTIVKGDIYKIIPINSKNGIYMIAYTDNKGALNLKKYIENTEYNRKYLCKLLEKSLMLIKNTLKLINIKGFYWNEGTHYYDPLGNGFKNRSEFIKKAQRPAKNIRIVGEMISRKQGWTEGALESVDQVITEKWICRN